MVNVKSLKDVRPDEAPPEELAVAEVLWCMPKPYPVISMQSL